MNDNKEIWEAVNNLIEFYRNEVKKYQDMYFKLKEECDILRMAIMEKKFDDFRYKGYKLEDLYQHLERTKSNESK